MRTTRYPKKQAAWLTVWAPLNAIRLLVNNPDNGRSGRTCVLVLPTTAGSSAAETIMKHAAGFLRRSFRPVDHICRINSSEFAIIMSRVDSSIREQVQRKIERINELLKKPENNLPVVSLAVGVAFADRTDPGDSILNDAEAALARLKEEGKIGCAFY